MFTMTKEWLHEYYGSLPGGQESQAVDWLLTNGKDVSVGKANEWKIWKHLIEYQPNTPDIVPQCLQKIETKFEFESELQAHRFVNMLRVPISFSYEQALAVAMPKKLLELGVGGDSGISTSIFLAYAEKVGGTLFSVDINPLNMTFKRYEKYIGSLWNYKLDDSLRFLDNKIALNERYDLIFIDTSHTYEHTMQEMGRVARLTNFMLMDDALFPGNDNDAVPGGVKKAISDWFANNRGWELREYWQGGTVLISKGGAIKEKPKIISEIAKEKPDVPEPAGPIYPKSQKKGKK